MLNILHVNFYIYVSLVIIRQCILQILYLDDSWASLISFHVKIFLHLLCKLHLYFLITKSEQALFPLDNLSYMFYE